MGETNTSTTATCPSRQTAIVAAGEGPEQMVIRHDAAVPELWPKAVLVRTAAVAVNQVDAKLLDYSPAPGAVIGHDFSGTVVALGESARAAGRLAVGNRVAGLVHGMNKLRPDVGAFAEYVAADADLVLQIPDAMSFEEAATLGVGVATAALALCGELGVPVPGQEEVEGNTDSGQYEGEFVLVVGGSSASGTRALQMLKMAGLRPITTCSPSNFDLVRRFGAEKAFDYNGASCAADIKAYTGNELSRALDCITRADTTQLCYEALGRAGGRYVALEPFQPAVAQKRPLTVTPSWVLALTVFGRPVALDGEYAREARPQDRRLGAAVFAAIEERLRRGEVAPHPIKPMQGGWQGVLDGVRTLRSHDVSGYKLVYSVL